MAHTRMVAIFLYYKTLSNISFLILSHLNFFSFFCSLLSLTRHPKFVAAPPLRRRPRSFASRSLPPPSFHSRSPPLLPVCALLHRPKPVGRPPSSPAAFCRRRPPPSDSVNCRLCYIYIYIYLWCVCVCYMFSFEIF